MWSWADFDRRPRGDGAPHLVDFAIRQRDAARGPVAKPLRAAEKSETVREAVNHDVAAWRGARAIGETRAMASPIRFMASLAPAGSPGAAPRSAPSSPRA